MRWDDSHPANRLSGYCQTCFACMQMPWFINACGRTRHLTLDETRKLGPKFVEGASKFLHSDQGRKARDRIDEQRVARARKWLFYRQNLQLADSENAIEQELSMARKASPERQREKTKHGKILWTKFEKLLDDYPQYRKLSEILGNENSKSN